MAAKLLHKVHVVVHENQHFGSACEILGETIVIILSNMSQ